MLMAESRSDSSYHESKLFITSETCEAGQSCETSVLSQLDKEAKLLPAMAHEATPLENTFCRAAYSPAGYVHYVHGSTMNRHT